MRHAPSGWCSFLIHSVTNLESLVQQRPVCGIKTPTRGRTSASLPSQHDKTSLVLCGEEAVGASQRISTWRCMRTTGVLTKSFPESDVPLVTTLLYLTNTQKFLRKACLRIYFMNFINGYVYSCWKVFLPSLSNGPLISLKQNVFLVDLPNVIGMHDFSHHFIVRCLVQGMHQFGCYALDRPARCGKNTGL